jgi:ABC-type branched-subunit amino acid transport system substrate-binding protein
MISVRNHRPLLSGNKWLIYLWITLVAAACSPKLQPVQAPVKPAEKPVAKAPEPPVKAPAKVATISLLLPFELDYLKTGYSTTALKQANIAVDYYQGFKMALDSLTAQGYNYRLLVYDTRDLPSQSHSLAYNPDIRASDLIVGPVFPEGLKAFTSVLTSARKPILSPLAASAPSTFKNQNLVTAIPPLEYHAWAAADYVVNDIKAKKVFILKSGYTVDNEYITPFKKGIDSLGKKRIKVNQLTVTRGNLNSIVPQLSLTEQNVFIVPSTNQSFLLVTLRTLDSLSKKYPITVFGHPSWGEVSFLKAELLQNLKTHITSSNNIDYKADATLEFTRNYRKTFKAEASEYSIKGFDEGMYFGNLLGKDNDGLKNLGQNKFTGLHNSFRFVKKPGLGWINTHVNVLKYTNFALKQVK